ncbi:hypothetical protein CO053_00440, partial [Candidatus Shapirobacteria bacterium CG_4_9_14_0_2_um_filter_40_11]
YFFSSGVWPQGLVMCFNAHSTAISTPEVPIELRLEQIKQRITEMAQQQAISAGIGSYWQEARRIAQACDMFNLGSHGYDNQSLFVSF